MIGFDGRTPAHVGYLVEDVDRVHSLLAGSVSSRIAAPFELQLTKEDIDVGEPGALRIVLAKIGDTLMEFIQPLGPDSTYWSQALGARGSGIHHVCFSLYDDFDAGVAACGDAGLPVVLAGRVGAERWCYVEAAGMTLELASGRGPSLDA